MNLRKSIPWYFASTGMRFKEQRAIWRRRKNPGHFITRLFLKGRPGNEQAFNSTQNRISSPKVFHVLFYRRSIGLQDIYFLYRIRRFAPDWIENMCNENMKNQGPRFERNYIIAKEQIRDEYGASYQSSPKIHRMLIARLTMKVYPTRSVCLSIDVIVIKLNFFSTPEVFTCSKVINAFCINLSKALLTKHEWHCGKCLYVLSHVVVFIPSFHGLR